MKITDKTNWESKYNKKFIKALLLCTTKLELEVFFEDLLTEKELKEISMRLRVAEMLLDDDLYVKIEKETKLSSATIARVAKVLLEKGQGYRNIFTKMYGKEKYRGKTKEKLAKYKDFSF
jgi:TrpR-related protein YerC/YecD